MPVVEVKICEEPHGSNIAKTITARHLRRFLRKEKWPLPSSPRRRATRLGLCLGFRHFLTWRARCITCVDRVQHLKGGGGAGPGITSRPFASRSARFCSCIRSKPFGPSHRKTKRAVLKRDRTLHLRKHPAVYHAGRVACGVYRVIACIGCSPPAIEFGPTRSRIAW